MSTASAYLSVSGIGVDVVYKDIKNLHIGVYPPIGRVRVAAPLSLDDGQVRLALVQRLPWIKRQREQLRAADRQSQREMVSGESHYAIGSKSSTAPAALASSSTAIGCCYTSRRAPWPCDDGRSSTAGTASGSAPPCLG